MGNFNASCAISGAPIYSGDKIRIILLTRSPERFRHGQMLLHPAELFSPATIPLRGVYDGYGSIEDNENSTNAKIIMAIFEDQLEKGLIKINPDSRSAKPKTLQDWFNAFRDEDIQMAQQKLLHRDELVFQRLTYTLVLDDVYEEILKLHAIPMKQMLIDADEFVTTYHENKTREEILQDKMGPDSDREERREWNKVYFSLRDWCKPLLCHPSNNPQKFNFFVSFYGREQDYFDNYWMDNFYREMIQYEIMNEQLGPKSKAWKSLRKDMCEFALVSRYIADVPVTWLPLQTASQTQMGTKRQFLCDIVSARIKAHKKQWKRDMGEDDDDD